MVLAPPRRKRKRVKPNSSDAGQTKDVGFLGTSSNQRAGVLLVLDHQQPAFSVRKMQSPSWVIFSFDHRLQSVKKFFVFNNVRNGPTKDMNARRWEILTVNRGFPDDETKLRDSGLPLGVASAAS